MLLPPEGVRSQPKTAKMQHYATSVQHKTSVRSQPKTANIMCALSLKQLLTSQDMLR
jgi:hypothetical protein